MSYEYFGVVTRVRQSGAGELQGLARFEKGVSDPHFDPARCFKPTGNVFVARLPSHIRVGAPVLFDAEENPHPKGPELWWVKPGARLELHGFAVLDAATLVVDPDAIRPALRQDRILSDGTCMYLRYQAKRGPCLRGPWTVKKGVFSVIDSELYEWSNEGCSTATHFRATDGSWEVLLGALDPELGLPLDLISDDQLARWFLQQAEEVPRLAAIPALLHREERKLLKSKFEDLASGFTRRLFEARFDRVLAIVKTLEFGRSELERIAKAPAFEQLWSVALHARKSDLEEEVRAGIAARLREMNLIAEEIEQLQSKKRQLDAELERVGAKIKKGRADISAQKRKLNNLEVYVGENQKRLLNDARAFAPLLVGRDSRVPVQLPANMPARDESRAAPGGLRSVTVLACCLTLLPDPFFAREMAAEQGWRMFVLQVEPHWLCFDDAWRAGLRPIIEATLGDGIATILHLQDLDRSPAELWLRPVLDLASGLRDTLIEGAQKWPEALRITASLAPGPPYHPLGKWLLRHFAAPEPIGEQPGRDVLSEFNRQPHDRAAGPGVEPLGVAGLEPFVEHEMKTLTELLVRRSQTGDEEDRSRFETRAREIRLAWPLTFGRWP